MFRTYSQKENHMIRHLNVCFSCCNNVTNLPHFGAWYSANHKYDQQRLVARTWLAHSTE